VVRRSDGTEIRVEDPSGTLVRWLRGASAVQIRPDRIVRSARGGWGRTGAGRGPT
jgi:3-(3-hydroxy-phenyl)propionate hydroxylase